MGASSRDFLEVRSLRGGVLSPSPPEGPLQEKTRAFSSSETNEPKRPMFYWDPRFLCFAGDGRSHGSDRLYLLLIVDEVAPPKC